MELSVTTAFAVLLDVDGTLVDSNDAHARSWCDALARHKRPVAFAHVRRLIGKGGDKLLAEVANLSDEHGVGKQIAESRAQIFQADYLPKLEPFADSRSLVMRMREHGYKLAVATSAKGEEMDALLEIAGVSDLIDVRTSSDDADRSKPDPDILTVALEKLGVAGDHAIMLGDTPYDIEAASRAGARTIALLSGGWSADGLAGAVSVYTDCSDLLRHYDESPLASLMCAAPTSDRPSPHGHLP